MKILIVAKDNGYGLSVHSGLLKTALEAGGISVTAYIGALIELVVDKKRSHHNECKFRDIVFGCIRTHILIKGAITWQEL